MKLNIDKDVLLEKLNIANRFTSNRLSSVISLQGVLLDIEQGMIHIYTTNLNTYYHTQLPTKERGKARLVTEAKKITEFLSLLTPGEVGIEINDKKITIGKGKTKGSFPIMEAADFPLPPVLKEKEEKIPTQKLTKNLPLLLFAASHDETRPALTGVNFISQDEELIMVSTDGFRLSLIKEKSDLKLPSMLVPSDFIQEILRFIREEKEVGLIFSKSEKIVKFRVGRDEFYSRLIEGEFPPYEKVIPTDRKLTILADREELARNIKIVSVFARDLSNIVVLEKDKNGLHIKPKSDTEDTNEAFQEVEAKGEDIKIAFNFKFLLDFLNTSVGKRVVIELLRPDAPAIFKTEGDENYLHIIMPVRIQT